MGVVQWLSDNWFNLAQTGGIIVGLFFTSAALKFDARARRVSTFIEITKGHRDLWLELYRRPDLFRIVTADPPFERTAMSREEELFITLLILHLNSSYQAMKESVFIKPEGLRADIQQFFSKPMAKAVWEKLKHLQDEEFVRFVEEACEGQPTQNST